MMLSVRIGVFAVCSLIFAAGSGRDACAQQTAPTVPPPTELPITQTFLTSTNGWIALGGDAKVSLAEGPVRQTLARGALRLDYSVAKESFSAFGLPLGSGALAKANSFRFSVLSDSATILVFGMQEENGGRYVAFFSVPENKWQPVELAPADFVLSEGANDPKDPNFKLDLDKIQFVGMADVAQFSPPMDDASAVSLFNVKPGPHVLYVADFQITAAPLAGSLPSPTSSVLSDVIDDFAHPQVNWVTFGVVSATTYSRTSQPGRGLKVDYKQSRGKAAGILKMLGHAELSGATKLIVAVASEKSADLVVQIEDHDGNKFSTKAAVRAGTSTARVLSLALSEFKPAADAKDQSAKLNIGRAAHIVIIDATGLEGGVAADVDNTLYLGAIRAER